MDMRGDALLWEREESEDIRELIKNERGVARDEKPILYSRLTIGHAIDYPGSRDESQSLGETKINR